MAGESSDEKGTELQDAATKAGFDPSFVALALFPDVVNSWRHARLDHAARQAFARIAARSSTASSGCGARRRRPGTLKDTPQQDIETKTTSRGRR